MRRPYHRASYRGSHPPRSSADRAAVRAGNAAETRTYGYDNSDRLASVCFKACTCPSPNDSFIRWTYDPVGNRADGSSLIGAPRPV